MSHGGVAYRATLESPGLSAVNALVTHLVAKRLITKSPSGTVTMLSPCDANGSSLREYFNIPTAEAFKQLRDVLQLRTTHTHEGCTCDPAEDARA